MMPAPMAFPNTTLRHFFADAQSETCLPNKSGPAGIDTGARCSAIDHGHSGWSEGPDPESRDSGFASRPGMTVCIPE